MMRFFAKTVVLVLILTTPNPVSRLSAADGRDASWPQFRGDPQSTGVATGSLPVFVWLGSMVAGMLLFRVWDKAMAARSDPAHAMRIAAMFTSAGDKERALDWLETAYEARLQNMIYLRVNPGWDPLRSEPRFQELLRKMKLPVPS